MITIVFIEKNRCVDQVWIDVQIQSLIETHLGHAIKKWEGKCCKDVEEPVNLLLMDTLGTTHSNRIYRIIDTFARYPEAHIEILEDQ